MKAWQKEKRTKWGKYEVENEEKERETVSDESVTYE